MEHMVAMATQHVATATNMDTCAHVKLITMETAKRETVQVTCLSASLVI